MPGDPQGNGGCNFLRFPRDAYFVDLNDVGRAGSSRLLELPVTIHPVRACAGAAAARQWADRVPVRALKRAADHLFPRVNWFRPNGRNLPAMLQILQQASSEQRPYVQFMLHSSELMPGGSPTFSNERKIELLYAQLQPVFALARTLFHGRTLREFYDDFCQLSN
jgi:hypothetical protein